MTRRFVIEDRGHAEWIGEFDSRSDAIQELERLAKLPWDAEPNRAPCSTWKNCDREYYLLEFDTDSDQDWTVLRREYLLNVSARGVRWIDEARISEESSIRGCVRSPPR